MNRIIVVLTLLILMTSCQINEINIINNVPEKTLENSNENIHETSTTNEQTEIKESDVTEQINNNTIVKTMNYQGVISDIEIAMELDYYEDDTLKGTYYYEKYKENIELTGELYEGDKITLITADNSEKFLGKISGGNISGKWLSGDTNLYFNLWSENGDEYATGTNTTYLNETDNIVYDGDNIYYSLNNCLYKSNYDGSNKTVIIDDTGKHDFCNLILHNDELYFFDLDFKIRKVKTDGSNLQVLDIGYDVHSFIIYKERIYFIDNISMYAEETDSFRLISSDLNGEDVTVMQIPRAHLDDRARYEKYYMNFIYNDHIYFNSLEYLDPAIDVFKVHIKGSDIQYTNVLGDPIGTYEDMLYYTNTKSTNISKDNIDYDTNDDSVFLYESIGSNINHDRAYYKTFMDRNHIIITYRWKKDTFHKIIILDLDGNVINEKTIPAFDEEKYNFYHITATVIDDYVYYKYNKNYTFDGVNERIERFSLFDK